MSKAKTFKFKFTGDSSDFEKATGNVESNLGGLSGKIGTAAKAIAGSMAAAFVLDKIKDFGTELYNLGAEADIWQKKADIVFGSSADAVRDWAAENAAAMGMTKSEVVGAAAALGDLLVPMGATRSEAALMSQDVIGLSGALSAWSGGTNTVTEVNDILAKAMLGERDGLKALGIAINQAEVDQRALTLASADGRTEVSAMDRALATQQLIMEKSTDAQDAWAGSMHDGTKNLNRIKAATAEFKEKLGTALLPVVDKVVAFMVDEAIPAFQDMAAWLGPKLTAAGQALSDWWASNGPAITGFLLGVRDAAVEFGAGFMSAWNDDISPALDEVNAAVSELWEEISPVFDDVSAGLGSMGIDWEKIGATVGWVVGAMVAGIASTIRNIAILVNKTSSAAAAIQAAWARGEGAVGAFKTQVQIAGRVIGVTMTAVRVVFNLAAVGIRGSVNTANSALESLRTMLGRIKQALQWVKDKFNDVKSALQGGLSIPTPNWPTPPSWMKSVSNHFHAGTHSVPGTPGSNVPAILQAGEQVLSVAQARQRGSGGGGTVVVNAYGVTGRELVAEIERAVRDGVRSQWLQTAGVV